MSLSPITTCCRRPWGGGEGGAGEVHLLGAEERDADGALGGFWLRRAWRRPTAIAMPAPSSIEPVPGSQEFEVAADLDDLVGVLGPRDLAFDGPGGGGLMVEASLRRMRIGWPRAARWSISSASTVESAAAGIFGASGW